MASSSNHFSNSSSSSAIKQTIFGLFANTHGNTLQEKMLHALFDSLDYSLAKIEDYLSKNEGVRELLKLNDVIHLKWRINKLCRHLANGEKNKAEDFMKANLTLLPLLLKLKTTVKTPEGFTLYERTAAQIAMSAKDVGCDGCDLYLSSHAEPANTNLKKLFLYNHDNENEPFTYIINGTEQSIVRGTAQGQLVPEHFNTLKAMYSAPLMNKAVNLSYEGLTEAQYKAYAALLKITKEREHTKFVAEEGQKQMIQRYFNICYQDGEAEFEKQRQAQFPEGYEELSEQDQKELQNVFEAIARSNIDEECAAAIQQFKDYLKQKLETPITTGFYSHDALFLKALDLVDEQVKKNNKKWGEYWSRKSDLAFSEIIGPLEKMLAAHAGMALAQGVYYQLIKGEKLRRDSSIRLIRGRSGIYLSFFPGSGWIGGLGNWLARGDVVLGLDGGLCGPSIPFFKIFFEQKLVMCRAYSATCESSLSATIESPMCDFVEGNRATMSAR